MKEGIYSNGSLVIYRNGKGDIKVDILFQDENIWMTQTEIAELYQTKPQNITQHNEKAILLNVSLQDFTASSDIDWSKSIPEIDKQLYKKYGLSPEKISFIESKVRKM